MTKRPRLCDENRETIDKYEEAAFMSLAMDGSIPCCLSTHPANTRYYSKIRKLAEQLYALDKSK